MDLCTNMEPRAPLPRQLTIPTPYHTAAQVSAMGELYSGLELVADYDTRLLTIDYSLREDAPIRCSLECVSLVADEMPKYCAISYCQGVEAPSVEITINKIAWKVTGNVYAALRELRRRRVGKLWIDCLCIEQDNAVEKSRQVQWMHTIYTKAFHVYAWLGNGTVTSAGTLAFLSRQKVPAEANKSLSDRIPSKLRRGLDKMKDHFPHNQATGSTNITGAERKAIHHLLDSPFWQRVWILQEVSKPATVEVLCGHDSLSFDKFMKALLELHRSLGSTLIPEDKLSTINGIWSFRQQEQVKVQMTLVEALLQSQRSLASNPRDKLYALRSLACDGELMIPIPNYAHKIPRVFQDAARAIITSGCTDVLLLSRRRSVLVPDDHASTEVNGRRGHWFGGFRTHSDTTPDDRASWAPAWDDTSYCYPPWITTLVETNAKADRRAAVQAVAGKDLHMQGVKLESIYALSCLVDNNRIAAAYAFTKSHKIVRHKQTSPAVVLNGLWDIFTFGATATTHQCPTPGCVACIDWPSYAVGAAMLELHEDKATREYTRTIGRWYLVNKALPVAGKPLSDHMDRWRTSTAGKLFCSATFQSIAAQISEGLARLARDQMRIAVTKHGKMRVVYREALPGDKIYRLRLPDSRPPYQGSSPSRALAIPESRPVTQYNSIEHPTPFAAAPDYVSLPVILRRTSSRPEKKHRDFLYVGEVYQSEYKQIDLWTGESGWPKESFAEHKWRPIVLK